MKAAEETTKCSFCFSSIVQSSFLSVVFMGLEVRLQDERGLWAGAGRANRGPRAESDPQPALGGKGLRDLRGTWSLTFVLSPRDAGAESRRPRGGWMARKAPDIYNLTFYRKCLLRSGPCYENYGHEKVFPYRPQSWEGCSGLPLIAYSQSFVTLYWCQRKEGSLAKKVLDLEHSISLQTLYHRKGSGSSRNGDLKTYLSGEKNDIQRFFKKQVDCARKIKFI